MSGNLRILNAAAPQVIDPDTILSLARQADLKEVLVIGWIGDGDLYVAGSHPQYKDIFWLLENALSWMREQRDFDATIKTGGD